MDFDTWADSVIGPSGEGDDPVLLAEYRRWLRWLFDVEGPVDRAVVEDAFLLAAVEWATGAVGLVERDLEATTGRSRRIEVDIDEEFRCVRVTYRDGYGGWSSHTVRGLPGAFGVREVAEYLQDEVVEDPFGRWPVCPSHELGMLVARVIDGQARWWCAAGEHAVAPVGELRY